MSNDKLAHYIPTRARKAPQSLDLVLPSRQGTRVFRTLFFARLE